MISEIPGKRFFVIPAGFVNEVNNAPGNLHDNA
jgi:hypothetical protein